MRRTTTRRIPPLYHCLFLYPCLIFISVSCGNAALPEVHQTRLQMGTTVAITVIAGDRDQAAGAVEAAFAEIERIERLMSSYDEGTRVSILNSRGSIAADREIVHLLERAAGPGCPRGLRTPIPLLWEGDNGSPGRGGSVLR